MFFLINRLQSQILIMLSIGLEELMICVFGACEVRLMLFSIHAKSSLVLIFNMFIERRMKL